MPKPKGTSVTGAMLPPDSSVAHQEVVLVIGTTPDYVDWIRSARPGETLFVTEPGLRTAAAEARPAPQEEICCSLEDARAVYDRLVTHCEHFNLKLTGIACFDCENMLLTAELAQRFGLAYPADTAVHNCRNKLASKRLWRNASVACPKYQLAQVEEDAKSFARRLGGPCVVKPLSGVGSELTFRCGTVAEACMRFAQVRHGLIIRQNLPIFRQIPSGTGAVLMEEWIKGVEYSCDFRVEHGRAVILRMARKYPLAGGPFGITAAYELVSGGGPFDEAVLQQTLAKAAIALGVNRGFCMVDLMDRDGEAVLIEMAPRPGGDCLPWLVRAAAGIDMICSYLDFSRGRCDLSRVSTAAHVALRLFADRAGTLGGVDTAVLAADSRVQEIYIKRHPGAPIRLPPEDYDSWVLGHAVYLPDPHVGIEQQNTELARLVNIEWE